MKKRPIQRKIINISESSDSEDSDKSNEIDDAFIYIPHISKEGIEKILGSVMNIKVNKVELYQRALVHKSIQKYVKKAKNKDGILSYLKKSNECLEFVGDATIGLIIADYLYSQYPDKNEGDLTKYRTRIVRSKTLAFFAEKIGINGNILMSEQVIRMNGKKNKRFLEDAFEAFVGAIYYDKGFEIAKEFVLEVVKKFLDESKILKDDNYKDLLLRYAQFSGVEHPEYNVINEEGKPNERIFTMEVRVFGERQGKGKSKKKKDAETESGSGSYQKT